MSSTYPEPLNDLSWMRDQLAAMQRELDELKRGPAVPQPTLYFSTRAERDAVSGRPFQWAYVSADSRPGNNGPFQFFPGVGWKRPHGAETGSLVQMSGSTLPAYTLPFTGGTYNVTDYPDLAAYYGIGSGTFTLFNSGGRALIGTGTVADANNTIRTFTVGEKGGELTHTLSASEMPNHTHGIQRSNIAVAGGQLGADWSSFYQLATNSGTTQWTTTAAGGSAAHSLMQPWGSFPFAVRF